MTNRTPTPPRSNGWSAARRTARRSLTCAAVVIVLVVGGYVPGAFALATLTHVGMLP